MVRLNTNVTDAKTAHIRLPMSGFKLSAAVGVSGTPNWATQSSKKACATVVADILARGMTSGQREKRSTTIKRYKSLGIIEDSFVKVDTLKYTGIQLLACRVRESCVDVCCPMACPCGRRASDDVLVVRRRSYRG